MGISAKNTLNVSSSAELLSYIINQTPILSENIDLPVQGQSIQPIGKIIINNQRYRNAFINTVNLIGLTVIKRNTYKNPWESFTNKGNLDYGQQIRELILDLCNVYDYNEEFENKDNFMKTEVPNVFNYIHELNYQKYYHTTTSLAQLNMAFQNDDLFTFVEQAVQMLYTSYEYDKYIVNKYMLCRRMLDGTMTPYQILNYDTITPRQRTSEIKNVSNLMTFMKPYYNPAGVHRATPFENQLLIVNTKFQADFSTDVLATSYNMSEADIDSAKMVLIDGFDEHDTNRLQKLLKSAYVEFTSDEISKLKNIPACLISDDFFMNYFYSFDNTSNTKETLWSNPTTLEDNHFLHVWAVFSTSPFSNSVVYTKDTPGITSVSVSPSSVTSSPGQSVNFNAAVVATGMANKAVTWSSSNDKVTIDINGKAQIAADATGSATITATSIYDNTKKGTATLTISSGE